MTLTASPPDLLEAYLRPLPLTGEVLRFDLGAFGSTVTREMLQVRLRMTAETFGTGTELVPANVTPDGSAVEVDAASLLAANAAVRSGLEAGPEQAVVFLRRISATRTSLGRLASTFGGRVSGGAGPTRESFVRYVLAAAQYQALGALKFCLPETLRPELTRVLGDPAMVDAVLAPDEPTLWSVLSARELALAELRSRGPAEAYEGALARHRRAFGYLRGEDVDFRAHESIEAIDARVAGLPTDGERRRLSEAVADHRARKARARRLFADRLANNGDAATLVSQLLLARALAAHEDSNRRAKMRFLRDLRDLADLRGLHLEHAGLADFAAACPPAPRGHARRPMVRST